MSGSTKARLKRGPKRSLSEERILSVALDVLDRDGIASVTLRRLAGELGVNPMTLYIYFDTKDALLEALCARVLVDAFAVPPGELSWDEQLNRAMRGMHDALAARPGVAEFLLARPLRGPHLDHGRERALALMRAAGLDDDAAIDATRAVAVYVLGSAVAEAGRRRHVGPAAAPADPDRHPVLTELEREYTGRGAGQAFEFGLAQLIKGIRQTAEAAGA